MLITCPECSSQFLVDRIEFGTGARRVRCSDCGYDWHQPVLQDQTQRRVPPQTTNRFHGMPPESGSEPAAVQTQKLYAASEAETTSSWADNEATSEPTNIESQSPNQEFTSKSGNTSQELAGQDPALAAEDGREAPAGETVEAAQVNDDAPEDTISFEGESLDPEQNESISIIDGSEEKPEDLDPDAKDIESDIESDKATAWQRLTKAHSRRWMIPAAAAAGVALIIAGLLLAQDGIVRVFPTWAGAYETLGISSQPVIGAGLEFHQVTSRREWSGAEEVLIVRGQIANVTDEKVSLPSVRVTLYNGEDAEVQAVTVANALPVVSPGEKVPFEARIPGPAVSAQRIRVNFDAPVNVSSRNAS